MGIINNAIVLAKVHFKIRPIVFQFTENNPGADDLDFLFGIERTFGYQLKCTKQIVDTQRRISRRIRKVTSLEKSGIEKDLFPDYRETSLELMLTFAYLLSSSIERDRNIDNDKKQSSQWLIQYWMVYKAKELIPTRLDSKLGHLPKQYKNPILKNKPLHDIHYYIMSLFVERRKKMYSNLDGNSLDQTVNELAMLTFVTPLAENINNLQDWEVPKMLVDTLKLSIVHFPKLYDLMKSI